MEAQEDLEEQQDWEAQEDLEEQQDWEAQEDWAEQEEQEDTLLPPKLLNMVIIGYNYQMSEIVPLGGY